MYFSIIIISPAIVSQTHHNNEPEPPVINRAIQNYSENANLMIIEGLKLKGFKVTLKGFCHKIFFLIYYRT